MSRLDEESFQAAESHRRILEAAKKSLDALFEDTSVARSVTWGELSQLRDDITVMMSSIPSD